MKAEDVIELFKDCYGYVKDIEGVTSYLEEHEASLTLSEEILYTIFDYNLRLQDKLESDLRRKNNSSGDVISEPEDDCEDKFILHVTKNNLLDVSTYRNSILSCDDTDFITELLPSSFEKNYDDIIFSLLLSFYNDINDAFELSSQDDKDFWLDEVEKYKNIVKIIKEYIQENQDSVAQEEISDKDSVSKKKIVFLKNTKGEPRIISDVLDIDVSDYPYILTILNNIKDGKVKHIKKFYNHEELRHIYAIRQGDVRVFFANLTNDTVIILGAIAKRFQNSSLYSELLSSRSNRFSSQKESIMSSLDSQEYLKENEESFNQLVSLLSVQKKRIKEGE